MDSQAEASCVWFKSHGVVVFQNVVIGMSFSKRSRSHCYDHVLMNFNNNSIHLSTGEAVFYEHPIMVPWNAIRMFIWDNPTASAEDVAGFFGQFTDEMAECMAVTLGEIHMYKSAIKLQRAWRRCISDPEYQTCRSRLMREAQECVFV